MENYLSKDSKDSLLKIIDYIKNSDEYKKCILLKKEIKEDKNLTKLINEVKVIQKKYVKSNFDEKIKKELDLKNELLENNKLFCSYNYYLDKVNKNIDVVKNELNDYFINITDYKFE